MPLRFLSPRTAPAAEPASGSHVVRPAIDAPPCQFGDHSQGLVRVLNEEFEACGPWNPTTLDRPDLVAGLRHMTTVRAFDAAMLLAHRQGKTSFYMQSLGEEAIACAHRRALSPGDMTFPTYRQQGLLIAADYPLVEMVNQVFSNSADPLRGRQLPVFYSSKATGFFSISGNLATQYIHAVGWAMAAALRGDTAIASAWIGEGATAEADFFSALLFASTYQAPVILNIVNNQWAISTREDVARGGTATFADRGVGFGVPSLRVDGNDYLAVYSVSAWAAERARAGHGPTLIEWMTYRVGAHSTSDDPSAYRAKDAGAQWPYGDPIRRLELHLREKYAWTDAEQEELDGAVRVSVAAAVAEGEQRGTVKGGPWSPPSTMFDDVYADIPPHLDQQRQLAGF